MLQQNLYFTSSLALLGGVLQVLAVLVLAYLEYQKTHKSKKYSMVAQLFFITKLFGYLGIKDFPTNVRAGVKMIILGACVVLAVGLGHQIISRRCWTLFKMQLAAKAWVAILVFFAATSGHYCVKNLFHVLQEKDSIGNVRMSLSIVFMAKITSSILFGHNFKVPHWNIRNSIHDFSLPFLFLFDVCRFCIVSSSNWVVDHCFSFQPVHVPSKWSMLLKV